MAASVLTSGLGRKIPSIAFGTWKIGNGQPPIDKVGQAIDVGFDHVGKPGDESTADAAADKLYTQTLHRLMGTSE